MNQNVRQRLDCLAVFLVVSCSSVLLTSGNIRSADYLVACSVADNLLVRGSLEATPVERFESFAVMDGPGGRSYSRFGFGHSLLGVPGVLLGRSVAAAWTEPTDFLDLPLIRFYPVEDRVTSWIAFFALMTNSVVLGALAAAMLALCGVMGLSRRQGMAAALLAGIGSPLFFIGSDFTAEPASALAVTLAACALVRIETGIRDGHPVRLLALAAGLAMGATVLLKIAHGVLLFPGVLAFALAVHAAGRRSLAPWCLFAVGLAVNLCLVLLYNLLRFGTVFETGYTDASDFVNPLLEGAAGQLFSPGHGLLIHFPAALVAFAGVRLLWTKSRSVAILSFGTLFALWALYSPWHAWEGGWTYGPRLLSPTTALLAVPFVLAVTVPGHRVVRAVAWIAALLSVSVSLLGFAVDYIDYCFYLWKLHGDATESVMRWSITDAPVIAYWTFPEHRGLVFGQVARSGFPWFLTVLFAIASSGLLLGLTWLLKGGQPPDRCRSEG